MTLPGLIQNYQKHVVETKLKRVYSVMNEAVRLAEVKHGDKKYWDTNLTPMEFYNKYYKGILKVTSVRDIPDDANGGAILISFADGSLLRMYTHGRDYFYFTNSAKYLKQGAKYDYGKDNFLFRLNPSTKSDKFHYNLGFEPYKLDWNGELYSLKNRCKQGKDGGVSQAYCAAWIQYNGWKIPEDYPFKF